MFLIIPFMLVIIALLVLILLCLLSNRFGYCLVFSVGIVLSVIASFSLYETIIRAMYSLH